MEREEQPVPKPAGHDIGELDLLSPSRVRVVDQCTLAYRYKYVDLIPAAQDNAAAMFGNVVHHGLEEWYGEDGTEGVQNRHRELPLGDLFRRQWAKKLPPIVLSRLMEVLVADQECEATAAAIMISRPDLQQPRQTRQFLASEAWQAFLGAQDKLTSACAQHRDIRWPKDENPFKAFNRSLSIAERMERRWKHLARPLAVERAFKFELDNVIMRGRIDQLRLDIFRGGLVKVRLVDVKTGREPLSQMVAFLQAWMYYEAITQADDLPSVDEIEFYLARPDRVQRGVIDPKRHRRLAMRILDRVLKQINEVRAGRYAPQYGHWCDRCDYKDLCEREIGIWLPGTDGFVIEAA